MAAPQQVLCGQPLGARFAGATLSDVAAGRTAIVGVRFNTDGTLELNQNGITSTTWYGQPVADIGALFWVRGTLQSGSPNPSGIEPLGSWLPLSVASNPAGKNWSWSQSTVGTITATVLYELATDAGGANIVASGTFNLTAQRTS